MTEPQQPPSEEELRAAYEAEIKKIRVQDVLLEHVVTLVNLGMRRTGSVPGTEDERDVGQVRLAIEAIRALLPLLDQGAPQQVGAVREALSQLQLAFVKVGGETPSGEQPAPAQPRRPPGGDRTAQQEGPKPGEPGPAQRSGKLWVPGQ